MATDPATTTDPAPATDPPDNKANDAAPNQLPPATLVKPSKDKLNILDNSVYKNDIESILLTEDEISKRIKEMGQQISSDYSNVVSSGEELVIIGLLRGAFMFTSDLVRNISVKCSVDFMMLQQRKNKISIKLDITNNIENKHILICEDLIDSGATLMWLVNHLKNKKVKSVKIACFLSKNTAKRNTEFHTNVKVNYLGYTTTDEWIVGYGMDHDQGYRSLNCVACLKKNVYGGGLLFDPNKKKWTD